MTSGRQAPQPGPPRHEEPGQGSAPGEASGAEAAGVRLRPMTQADVPAVAQLEAELFGGEAWSPALLADELAAARQGDRVYLVGHPDGAADTVVAYGGVWVGDGQGDADVLTIATVPTCRRRGVGGAVLDALVAIAREAGCHAVLLEVRRSNLGAQLLYGSRQFEVIGHRRRYYDNPTEDAVVMRLPLSHGPGPVGAEAVTDRPLN